MIRVWTLLLLLILPMSAAAQTVRVRSGDHAGFSRLLLLFDAEARWEFGRVEGGFEFRPENTAIAYDTGSVFDLIKRERIAGIEDRGDGRLFLRVDCDCHGDAFDLRNGQVVLDIKDGAPLGPSAQFERRLEDLASPAPRVEEVETRRDRAERPPYAFVASGRRATPDRAGLPLTFSRDTVARAPVEAVSQGKGPIASTLPPEMDSDSPAAEALPVAPPESFAPSEPDSRVSETQAVLLEQIARAAAQGLLEADLRLIDEGSPDLQKQGSPPSDALENEPEPTDFLLATERSHVAIETGVDRAATGSRRDITRTDEGENCIPNLHFDVASWGGTDERIGQDLGALRGRTIGEFDATESDGVTNLVRHYVYLTFGAEALAMIRRYPGDVVRGDLLSIMAEVMDNGSSADAISLVEQMNCNGETALWSVLAQPRLYRTQPVNTEAVALAFAGLPRHIRSHLGAGLVMKFMDIDDIETADMLKNAIERGGQEGPSQLDAVAVRFDRLQGEAEAARIRLDEIVARGDGAMPGALLDHVEAVLAEGGAVSAEQISLLESLAFERRGSAESTVFLIAATRAQAFAGDFDAAFSGFAKIGLMPGLEASEVEALARELFGRLTGSAADATFLRHLLPRLDLVVGLPADDRRQLANRLLDLGLPTPSRRILGGEGALPEPADRLLYARAAMLEGRPEVAIGYLAGIESEAAIRQRAAALESAADYGGAFRDHLASGDTEAARRVAWRGELWEDLSEIGEGPMRDVAQLMTELGTTGELGALAQPPASLAGALDLINRSRESRATFQDLLDATDPRRIEDSN